MTELTVSHANTPQHNKPGSCGKILPEMEYKVFYFKNTFCFTHNGPGKQDQGQRLYFFFHAKLSTKFQLLIKTKIRTIPKFLALRLSEVVFIMLINVKMPTIVAF